MISYYYNSRRYLRNKIRFIFLHIYRFREEAHSFRLICKFFCLTTICILTNIHVRLRWCYYTFTPQVDVVYGRATIQKLDLQLLYADKKINHCQSVIKQLLDWLHYSDRVNSQVALAFLLRAKWFLYLNLPKTFWNLPMSTVSIFHCLHCFTLLYKLLYFYSSLYFNLVWVLAGE